jgi:tetratricopeptide (TPR) repeat protein
MYLTRNMWRKLWVLYLFMMVYAFSVVIFYVFSRYRFPLVPVILLFAAAGVVKVIRELSAKRFRGLASAALIMALTAVFANWPIVDSRIGNFQAVMHGNIGLALANQGHYEAARSSLERALVKDPAIPTAYLNMGNVLRRTGRDREALAYLQKAAALQPTAPEYHLELGRCFSVLGRSAEAISSYRQTISLDPLNAWAYYWAAQELDRIGNRAEAQRYFSEARRLNPGFK